MIVGRIYGDKPLQYFRKPDACKRLERFDYSSGTMNGTSRDRQESRPSLIEQI
jgi:hypothetical protein